MGHPVPKSPFPRQNRNGDRLDLRRREHPEPSLERDVEAAVRRAQRWARFWVTLVLLGLFVVFLAGVVSIARALL